MAPVIGSGTWWGEGSVGDQVPVIASALESPTMTDPGSTGRVRCLLVSPVRADRLG